MTSLRRRGATLSLALLALAACQGRPAAVDADGTRSKTGPKVALVDLSNGAPEKNEPSPFALSAGGKSFDDLLSRLETVANDADTRAVFVRWDGALGLARAYEIGHALAELRRAGKKVHCHAHGYDNTTVLGATLGCDRIAVSPAGGIEAVGLAGQVTYLRKFLVEELKLSIDILQVGKFKGAEEPLTRDGPSDEARASLEGVLGSFRDSWLEGIRSGRGDEAALAAEDGPYSPTDARAKPLLDAVAYADDELSALRSAVGATRVEVVFGKGDEPGASTDTEIASVLQALSGADQPGAPVALVRAVGSIGMAAGGGLLGGGSGISYDGLAPVLRKLERDDAVKAVVLRIDSPGGSALASDLLWHRLMALRAKKPLVVSVGDMAASGGYYMASASSWILADPVSLVGSIGVVGGKVGVGPALEHWGVHTEVFPAKKGPGAAERAAYASPMIAWDEPTKQRVQEGMSSVYDLFLARISEGRGMPVEKVAASAEGRVWSGVQGKERGLVDELGGLRRAIEKARELGHLDAKAAVRVVSETPAWLEGLGGEGSQSKLAGEAARAAVASVDTSMVGVSPELVQAARAVIGPLAAGEQKLCAAPWTLRIR